jgi:hypothetical protein
LLPVRAAGDVKGGEEVKEAGIQPRERAIFAEPEPSGEEKPNRDAAHTAVFYVPCTAVVFLYVDESHLPSSPTPSLRPGATKVRTVLPHSSVDAPAFEPRGNAVSSTALPRTLLVMPAFKPG